MDYHSALFQILASGIEFGLLNALFVTGIAIAFRFGNFPDLTVEGSLIIGATVAALSLKAGHAPETSLAIGALVGALAGFCTAIIHILTKMSRLLAGIVMASVLYALSLRLMQGSNLPIFDIITLIPRDAQWIERSARILLVVVPVTAALLLFLNTEFGMLLRATAENWDLMQKIKRPRHIYLIVAVVIANASAGISGAILCNYNRFADVSFGTGAIITGLASLLIGEVLVPPTSVLRQLLAALVGSLLYYTVYALALRLGLHPWDLKIASAAFVVATVALSRVIRRTKSRPYVGSDPL